MSLIDIPNQTDGTPCYRQRTRLDGQDWTLDFVYNARQDSWALSILTLEDVPVMTGQAIVCGLPLLARAIAGPPGQLWAFSEDGSFEPPGLTELGARVKLTYVDASDPLNQ